MKCKKCGTKDKWRCPVYQSVDIEIDEKNDITSGFDFSDPELENDKIFCGNCREYLNN